MSGVYCVYHRDHAPLPASILAGMGEAMRHRAPDGIRTWQDGVVGMGHCCFNTTPLSGAAEFPYTDENAGLVISADARIDNRDELFQELGVPRDARPSVTDGCLILQAYRKWGTQCVTHLLGDFVFIIRDLQQQQVFCARDHLGIKPFYYHISAGLFAAASEVRAVLKVPQVTDAINEPRIADFLVSQLEGFDKTSTFYTSVRRLPPAHSLLVKQGRYLLTEYWKLDPERETRYQRDADYIEAFQDILARSVKARLRSRRKPALLLSGGIDSAAVAAFSCQSGAGGNNLPDCYSAISETPDTCRESHFISSVGRHLHLKLRTLSPQALRIYDEKLHAVYNSIEEPFDDMTLIVLLYIAAREDQHDVVLDGAEGDMVHSLSAAYAGLLLKQGRLVRGMNEIYGCWRHRYNRQYALYKTINDAMRPVLVPEWLRKIRHRFSGPSMCQNIIAETCINPEFAARARLLERLRRLYGYSKAGRCKTLRELHIQNISHPYLAAGLERYDRLAALCGVEPRHPLLDKRLVEFSCSLPWDQKVRHGWSKYLLRRVCLACLPADVVWRRGWEHLGWTFTSTLLRNNREVITGQIASVMPGLKKYMNGQCLNDVLQPGRSDFPDREMALVWSAFLLASWLQNRSGIH